MKKIIIIAIFVLILIVFAILGFVLSKNNSKYDLKIHFFDAGKADAILISYNDNIIMIDTGEDDLADEIASYLKNDGHNKIDYLIITHFDKDHVGSASKLIDEFDIGCVFQSNYPKESVYYSNYLNSLNNKNIVPETIVNDKELTIDDLTIKINGPKIIYENNESNNSSLITSLIYKDNSFLFMGDAQNARIKSFIEEDNSTYDFLKVPYHGRYLKRLDDLLLDRNIKYAVITSSLEEVEDDKTTETLDKYNIKYYLTRNGEIDVLSDGKNINIKQ